MPDENPAPATSFDDIVAETVAELAPEDTTPAPTTPEPVESGEEQEQGEEPKEEETTEEGKPEPEEEEKQEEEPKETEEEEEPETPDPVTNVLESLKGDKEKLEALLRLIADDENIAELPAVKELLGRERQSATDKTRNELERERLQQQAIHNVLAEGTKAIDTVAGLIDAVESDLAKYLETGEGEIKLPTREVIEDNFNKFANAAVHAYHNEQMLPLGELIYSLPELQQTTENQQRELQQAAGAAPADWLATHLNVARENLWAMAMATSEEAKKQEIADLTSVLTETHKTEIEKIKAKHEKEIEKAVTKAKDETRLQVLAEQAQNGAPPRSPSKEPVAPVVEEDDDGTIESIWAAAKRGLEKQHGAGV